jgi:signal transduction histidine kinase
MSSTAPIPDASLPPRPAGEASDDVETLEGRKRAFLRLVSHELRTPLNSILGFSEILSAELYGPLGAPQYKEYADIIRGSGQRLLKLLNQVLELGRLDGLRLEVGPEPLEPALDEAVSGLAEDFAARAIRARVLAEARPAMVLADPWALRAVFTHLIQNAVTFSPEGGEVRLRVRRAGEFIDICIEDDGEGLDPADLPRLMRPFEQGDSALVRRSDGAGLGLTIADLTCRAMGAHLSLHARPGRGVSAQVRLKAA